jgi:hypothetical protein
MLAYKTSPTERGSHLKAWIGNPRHKLRRFPIDPGERAQIDSHCIVLAGDASLKIGDFQ